MYVPIALEFAEMSAVFSMYYLRSAAFTLSKKKALMITTCPRQIQVKYHVFMSFGKLKSLVHRRKSLQGASCQSNGIVVVAVMNLSDVMTSLLKAADICTDCF